jgi:tetratricopeptide (TPR) repeat protein
LIGIGLALSLLGGIPAHLPAEEDTPTQELFWVAQRAFDDGFYDVAIRYIEQFLELNPDQEKLVQAKLLLGQCYFFKNQYLKSYSVFKELLPFDVLKDATYFWLGETYFKASDYNQAAHYYQQVLENYPQSDFIPQALYSLGWTFFEKKAYDKANKQFQELITRFPDHPLSEDASFKIGECEHNQGHYEIAINLFQKYLERFPEAPHKSEAFFYLAEATFYRQDYLTAMTYYAKAADLAVDPKIIYIAKVSMGWCYLKLEKFDLSKRNFLEAEDFAINKDVLSDDVYWGLATLFTQIEDFPSALEAYTNIIKLFPENTKTTEALLGRANIHYAQQDYPMAIKEYQRIIDQEKMKSNGELLEKAYYGLAWTYLKSGNLDKSIGTFQAIISQSDSNIVKVSALTQMGDAHLDSGYLKEAINIYDKILKEYPDSAYIDYIQFRLGIALIQSQRLDTAILSFKSLLNNFPNSKYSHEALYYLGIAYFKKNEMPQAVEFLSQYLTTNPSDKSLTRDTHFLKGLAFFQLKEYQKAIETFQTIEHLFPREQSVIQVSQLNIAKCLYHMGRTAEALSQFESIVQNYSGTESALEALLWLGNYNLEQGELEPAIQYYKKALEQFPSSPKINVIYFELGQSYTALGEYDQAIRYYQKIPQEASPEIFGKAQLAIADIFSKDIPPEEALETYQKIGQVAPDYKCDALIKVAGIYIKQENYPAAIEALETARKNYTSRCEYSPAELQFSIADTYELLNMTNKAIEEYFKIPYLYTHETGWIIKAYLRIGRLFEDQENWEEAKRVYSRVLEHKTAETKYAEERLDWIKKNVINHQGTD